MHRHAEITRQLGSFSSPACRLPATTRRRRRRRVRLRLAQQATRFVTSKQLARSCDRRPTLAMVALQAPPPVASTCCLHQRQCQHCRCVRLFERDTPCSVMSSNDQAPPWPLGSNRRCAEEREPERERTDVARKRDNPPRGDVQLERAEAGAAAALAQRHEQSPPRNVVRRATALARSVVAKRQI